MVSTAPIYQTRSGQAEPFYAPTFRVEVGESAGSLQTVYDVVRVAYKDAVNQIDSFDLTTANGRWRPDQVTYTGERPGSATALQILPGTYVRLWMGYETTLGLLPMLTGRVTSVTPSFGESGTTLTVRALSSLEALRARPREQRWPQDGGQTGIHDSEIARTIAGRYDVTLVVPRGLREAAEPSVTQGNETDISFLIQRAKRRGYVVCFREILTEPAAATTVRGPRQVGGRTRKVLYFGPSDLLRDVERGQLGERPERLELAWGHSLVEFRPTLNLSTNLWSKVKISFWDRRTRTRTPLEYTLEQLCQGEGLNRDLWPLIPVDALGEHDVSGVPVHTGDEARDLLRNTLRENFLQLLTADGTTVGQPELRAGSRVEVRGVGEPFSGSYFITSTTHSIDDNGYRTQFNARREQLAEGS